MGDLSPTEVEREAGAASAELAERMRRAPPAFDELTRARMERGLLQAWRVRGMPLPRAERSDARAWRLGGRRAAWIASLALSACAGGFFALHLSRPTPIASVLPAGHFELAIDDAAVQSGPVSEGQLLRSGARGRIALELGAAHLDMQPRTELRLSRLSETELAFALNAGQLDVDFHPQRRGEQGLRVETPAARVLVVGTRFRVVVESGGDTRVAVVHGAVDVVSRSSGQTQRVVAGGEARVPGGATPPSQRDEGLLAADGPVSRGASRAADEDMVGPPRRVRGANDVNVAARERLEVARKLLRRGEHPAARAVLRELAEPGSELELRVEALTLMAESYTAQGSIRRAQEQYRSVDAIAPRRAAGDNARFALARSLERHSQDRAAAVAAYRRYLALAPEGALSEQARKALCRLGSASDCSDP